MIKLNTFLYEIALEAMDSVSAFNVYQDEDSTKKAQELANKFEQQIKDEGYIE